MFQEQYNIIYFKNISKASVIIYMSIEFYVLCQILEPFCHYFSDSTDCEM